VRSRNTSSERLNFEKLLNNKHLTKTLNIEVLIIDQLDLCESVDIPLRN